MTHKDAPQAIAPTDKERLAGVYSPRNLQRVLGALHQDGLVVLKDVIDKEHIDSLNAVMTADAEKRIADPNQQFNHNVKCKSCSVVLRFPTLLCCHAIGLSNSPETMDR